VFNLDQLGVLLGSEDLEILLRYTATVDWPEPGGLTAYNTPETLIATLHPSPEPATLTLFGAGLLAAGIKFRKRFKGYVWLANR